MGTLKLKNRKLLRHLGFWITLWGVQSLLMSGGDMIWFYLIKNIPIVGLQLLVFLITKTWLFPHFFASKKYVIFGILCTVLVYLIFTVSFSLIGLAFLLEGSLKDISIFPIEFSTDFWTIVSGSSLYWLSLLFSTLFLVLTHPLESKLVSEFEYNEADAIIVLKEGHIIHRVPVKDIVFVKGLGEYVVWHTVDRKIVTLQTLHGIESQWSKAGFIRVHRSFIVNTLHVRSLTSNVVKVQEETVPVGRKYRKDVSAFFEGVNQ